MKKQLLRLLKAVLLEGKYANLVLQKALVTPQVTNYFYGVIENNRYLEAIISYQFPRKISPQVLIYLKILCYEVLFWGREPAKVVNQAITEAKSIFHEREVKFINYFGRHFQFQEPPYHYQDEIDRLAIRYSFPTFLVRLWYKQYGMEVTERLLVDSAAPRENYVFSVETLPEESFRRTDVYPYGYRYIGKRLLEESVYLRHQVLIQNISSQLVVSELQLTPQARVLDMCGAPGTKSLQLSFLYPEIHIDLLDIHPHRIQLVQQHIQKYQRHNIFPQVADATQYRSDLLYDAVICDVPCCGYGVLKGKSDLKLRLDGREMDTLIPVQAQILANASTLVQEGGQLLYATCSLNKKENEYQIAKFMDSHPQFRLVVERTIMPYQVAGDGFYYAILRKQ